MTYGADGQRISKTVGDPTAGGYREYYIRDAQGNIMATYTYTSTSHGVSVKCTDRPIYGSKRIGSYTKPAEIAWSPIPTNYVNYVEPMSEYLLHYELNDHLGNVTAVVTGHLAYGNDAGSPWQADLKTAQGYEAFGSLLPGRSNLVPTGVLSNALIVNEDFEGAQVVANQVNGWTPNEVAVFSIDAANTDRLKVSDAVVFDGPQLVFATIPNEPYTVTLDIDLGSTTRLALAVYSVTPYVGMPGSPIWTSSGTKTFTFTAISSQTRIKCWKVDGPSTTYFYIDNVKVEGPQQVFAGNYRFGFNGQEKDDEVYGATGTSYAFEYRMLDARVGRFLSLDPLGSKYPHNSPYAFSENRVVDSNELEGLESIPGGQIVTSSDLLAQPILSHATESTVTPVTEWDSHLVLPRSGPASKPGIGTEVLAFGLAATIDASTKAVSNTLLFSTTLLSGCEVLVRYGLNDIHQEFTDQRVGPGELWVVPMSLNEPGTAIARRDEIMDGTLSPSEASEVIGGGMTLIAPFVKIPVSTGSEVGNYAVEKLIKGGVQTGVKAGLNALDTKAKANNAEGE
ncbi:MAG: hypothetical protein ACOH13_15790 [Flavobacteriales bacterium]